MCKAVRGMIRGQPGLGVVTGSLEGRFEPFGRRVVWEESMQNTESVPFTFHTSACFHVMTAMTPPGLSMRNAASLSLPRPPLAPAPSAYTPLNAST